MTELNQDHDTQQLLQALLGLQQHAAGYYTKLVEHLEVQRRGAINSVMSTNDPVSVAQHQGRYKELSDLLELMTDTRQKLREFEQGQ